MAQKNKRKASGKSTVSAGSNTPLLLGLLAVGAIFLLKSSSASAEPSGPTNSGAGYNNDPLTPNQVPVNMPPGSSLPANVPTTPVDNWGIPHMRTDTVDSASGVAEKRGQLYKALSDDFGLYFEEIDALFMWEQNASGNSLDLIVNWYWDRRHTFLDNFWAQGYNTAHPSAPIRRRT